MTEIKSGEASTSIVERALKRPELTSLLGAVLVFTLFMVVAPAFRSWDSMATVLYASSTIGIMAVAVGLLMIADEFDLSTGVAVTTAALAASMFSYNLWLNTWVGALIALVISLAIGFFNGFLVVKTKIASFLITLATFLMLQGINLAVTKLISGTVATPTIADMEGFPSARAVFASSIPIFGVNIRITVFWWLLFVIVGTFVLFKTRIGNWIFAVGGDEEAARAVGVPVRGVKIGLFMFVGFAAWFVGMHNLFLFDSIQAGQGVGNEFLYIIAAVIGGISMTGGRGTVVGTMIGALIFGMTNQGIVYAGWNPDWFMFFLGGTLLLAVLLNHRFERFNKERS
ncbi:ABC transporter permease [Corynebacterium glutamicum]|uniref:ABC transporter permease n=1 Tax=Corynebacterium glutamicum TaxID=1718 RepID=UPI000942E307|nr:ABC transporter permease [Corynebacterium glutamicum]OKX86666.1 ribose ABC transporter permease [Corynebacterium glutamicum]QDX74305.1 ribose ABC transporter permease [Corynebacterium glutamicum]QDX77063.1 ribose ABC transporter permease [Corynebacterium glutamicum]TWS37028.1 ribose ABC transporter permease [Corynebacterium glutamicum]TWS37817.1 ribose ABC transporter permease [Corynebacterium glutamicum]